MTLAYATNEAVRIYCGLTDHRKNPPAPYPHNHDGSLRWPTAASHDVPVSPSHGADEAAHDVSVDGSCNADADAAAAAADHGVSVDGSSVAAAAPVPGLGSAHCAHAAADHDVCDVAAAHVPRLGSPHCAAAAADRDVSVAGSSDVAAAAARSVFRSAALSPVG